MTNEKATDRTRIINGNVERLFIIYEDYHHPLTGEPDYDTTWEWRIVGPVPRPTCPVATPLL